MRLDQCRRLLSVTHLGDAGDLERSQQLSPVQHTERRALGADTLCRHIVQAYCRELSGQHGATTPRGELRNRLGYPSTGVNRRYEIHIQVKYSRRVCESRALTCERSGSIYDATAAIRCTIASHPSPALGAPLPLPAYVHAKRFCCGKPQRSSGQSILPSPPPRSVRPNLPVISPLPSPLLASLWCAHAGTTPI